MKLDSIAVLICAAALGGCASTVSLDKDVPVSPAALSEARKTINKEIGFQVAAYELSQSMLAERYCKNEIRPAIPFAMASTGYVKEGLTDEARAALRQLGVDSKARVIWVDPNVSPNVKVGDEVAEISGFEIGMGDVHKFRMPPRQARHKTDLGKPFKVELADGRKIMVQGPDACEAGTFASAFDPFPHQMGFDLTPGFRIPPNLFHQADSQADLQWLAAFAMYVTSTPEAEARRFKAKAANVAMLPVVFVAAFIPFGDYLTGKGITKGTQYIGYDGIFENAAEFATRTVHAKTGGAPMLGIEMFAKAVSKNLQVGEIVYTPEEMARLRKLAVNLRQGTAGAPTYQLPKPH